MEIISAGSGNIVTALQFDREEVDTYNLLLTATDRGTPPLSSTIPLTIAIQDLNDNGPIFSRSSWNLFLVENTEDVFIMEFNVCHIISEKIMFDGGALVYVLILATACFHAKLCLDYNDLPLYLYKVTDIDDGINAEVDFSLDNTTDGLFDLMDFGESRSIRLILTHNLDRENVSSYSFLLYAMDRGTPSFVGQTMITINVVVSVERC